MPGDVLLFQRLSVSTIGAVRFHGRVRDGIGWVTDAMVTKQWSWRVSNRCIRANFMCLAGLLSDIADGLAVAGLSLMVGFIKHEQSY